MYKLSTTRMSYLDYEHNLGTENCILLEPEDIELGDIIINDENRYDIKKVISKEISSDDEGNTIYVFYLEETEFSIPGEIDFLGLYGDIQITKITCSLSKLRRAKDLKPGDILYFGGKVEYYDTESNNLILSYDDDEGLQTSRVSSDCIFALDSEESEEYMKLASGEFFELVSFKDITVGDVLFCFNEVRRVEYKSDEEFRYRVLKADDGRTNVSDSEYYSSSFYLIKYLGDLSKVKFLKEIRPGDFGAFPKLIGDTVETVSFRLGLWRRIPGEYDVDGVIYLIRENGEVNLREGVQSLDRNELIVQIEKPVKTEEYMKLASDDSKIRIVTERDLKVGDVVLRYSSVEKVTQVEDISGERDSNGELLVRRISYIYLLKLYEDIPDSRYMEFTNRALDLGVFVYDGDLSLLCRASDLKEGDEVYIFNTEWSKDYVVYLCTFKESNIDTNRSIFKNEFGEKYDLSTRIVVRKPEEYMKLAQEDAIIISELKYGKDLEVGDIYESYFQLETCFYKVLEVSLNEDDRENTVKVLVLKSEENEHDGKITRRRIDFYTQFTVYKIDSNKIKRLEELSLGSKFFFFCRSLIYTVTDLGVGEEVVLSSSLPSVVRYPRSKKTLVYQITEEYMKLAEENLPISIVEKTLPELKVGDFFLHKFENKPDVLQVVLELIDNSDYITLKSKVVKSEFTFLNGRRLSLSFDPNTRNKAKVFVGNVDVEDFKHLSDLSVGSKFILFDQREKGCVVEEDPGTGYCKITVGYSNPISAEIEAVVYKLPDEYMKLAAISPFIRVPFDKMKVGTIFISGVSNEREETIYKVTRIDEGFRLDASEVRGPSYSYETFYKSYNETFKVYKGDISKLKLLKSLEPEETCIAELFQNSKLGFHRVTCVEQLKNSRFPFTKVKLESGNIAQLSGDHFVISDKEEYMKLSELEVYKKVEAKDLKVGDIIADLFQHSRVEEIVELGNSIRVIHRTFIGFKTSELKNRNFNSSDRETIYVGDLDKLKILGDVEIGSIICSPELSIRGEVASKNGDEVEININGDIISWNSKAIVSVIGSKLYMKQSNFELPSDIKLASEVNDFKVGDIIINRNRAFQIVEKKSDDSFFADSIIGPKRKLKSYSLSDLKVSGAILFRGDISRVKYLKGVDIGEKCYTESKEEIEILTVEGINSFGGIDVKICNKRLGESEGYKLPTIIVVSSANEEYMKQSQEETNTYYHGTNTHALPDIMRYGLLRGPGMQGVSLTTSFDFASFFADLSHTEREYYQKSAERNPVILELKIPISKVSFYTNFFTPQGSAKEYLWTIERPLPASYIENVSIFKEGSWYRSSAEDTRKTTDYTKLAGEKLEAITLDPRQFFEKRDYSKYGVVDEFLRGEFGEGYLGSQAVVYEVPGCQTRAKQGYVILDSELTDQQKHAELVRVYPSLHFQFDDSILDKYGERPNLKKYSSIDLGSFHKLKKVSYRELEEDHFIAVEQSEVSKLLFGKISWKRRDRKLLGLDNFVFSNIQLELNVSDTMKFYDFGKIVDVVDDSSDLPCYVLVNLTMDMAFNRNTAVLAIAKSIVSNNVKLEYPKKLPSYPDSVPKTHCVVLGTQEYMKQS